MLDERLTRAGAALYEWFMEGRDSDDGDTEELVTRLAQKHDLTRAEVRQAIRLWKGRASPLSSNM